MARIDTEEYVAPSGWGWNVHLVKLPSGGLFVYSPAWLGDDTFERIARHGTPEVLFAPNSVHHLSLEKFRARWPQAMACASKGALPRLSKHGHPALRDAAEAPLPDGARLLVAEGVDNGETIFSVGGEWIFCDAYINFQRRITGFPGFALRRLKIGHGLGIGGLFKMFVVKDRAAYKRWLFAELDRAPPTTVHFSHGAPIGGPDVVARLKKLANERLPT